ncbi:MAG: nucleotidyltransferase family protein [Dehalococcoidia bacterium]
MQIVILAGGLGERIAPHIGRRPKSLASVNGRVFLDYQLDLLRQSGFTEVVLCLGHQGEQIRAHVAARRDSGLEIHLSEDGERLLGTAGAVRNADHLLADEFFLTYGDSYLPIDYGAVAEAFRSSGKLALMVVYRNRNQFDRSNVVMEGSIVKVYDKKRSHPGMEYINYGISVLRKEAVSMIPRNRPFSQEDFYQRLISERQLASYETPVRFYEIGSPGGLEEFRKLAETGAIGA